MGLEEQEQYRLIVAKKLLFNQKRNWRKKEEVPFPMHRMEKTCWQGGATIRLFPLLPTARSPNQQSWYEDGQGNRRRQ